MIVEVPIDGSNPYLSSSSWRHNFTGGFILDMGVHFVAALRMIVGCEIASVAAMTSHVDTTLPPPDSMSSVVQLENGRSGVIVTVVSAKAFKVTLFKANGQTKSSSYQSVFTGVTEELKTFFNDVSQAILKDDDFRADPRISFLEGARDIAVIDAILESGKKQGALVQVKKF